MVERDLLLTEGCSADDSLVLHKYKVIYRKFFRDGIIDIDKRMKYKFDYKIYRLEEAMLTLSRVVPPSRQSAYWVVLVKDGTGKQSIGSFTFPIQKNTLFIIPERTVHSGMYNSDNFSGYMLMFDIDFFLKKAFPRQFVINRKIFTQALRPYLYLELDQVKNITDIFESILSEHKRGGGEVKEMIAIKVLELLIQCDRQFPGTDNMENHLLCHPVIEKFKELVESYYDSERSVQYYANALNVHPNHLNFLLKKYSGQNAKQCINNRIILESKYLLSNTSFIIKEIAHRLGFDDPNNFSTFFQKCTGMPPVAYRNENLKELNIV